MIKRRGAGAPAILGLGPALLPALLLALLLIPLIAASPKASLRALGVSGDAAFQSIAAAQRPVYIAAGLGSNDLIALSTNVSARSERGVVLLDSKKERPALKAFLDAYRPDVVVMVSASAEAATDLSQFLQATKTTLLARTTPAQLGPTLFARADEVVVCTAAPRPLLLQAACLAGTAQAPLLVLDADTLKDGAVQRAFQAWRTRKVMAVGAAAIERGRAIGEVEVEALADESAVKAAQRRLHAKKGRLETLVIANPADAGATSIGMSSLAPWVALQRRAALLLTGPKGDDAAALIGAALKDPDLAALENVILVGNLEAVPMERRPNPLAGKDEFIELEPGAPPLDQPFSLATGRLFDEDPAVVLLMLARQRLLSEAKGERKALVVSNPGGSLPLLETISRNTANELRNAGYRTTGRFENQVNKDELRRLLPEQDIFLWEGHHSTLVADYGLPYWPESLKPSLVFLQSCLALTEAEAHPFLRRGAIGVVGSRSRTYSASGGAFTQAYFDALAYDQQSLGGALRHAKNFLLAYAQLKEKRLGEAAKLGGASVRSAWAFTLWGDPTLKLPAPEPAALRLAPVSASASAKRITLRLPAKRYEEIRTEKYVALPWPNARLAGYVTKAEVDGRKRLLPLLFAELALPGGRGKPAPRLTTTVPEDRWTFAWDQRRGTGYLLVLARSNERKEMHFDYAW